MDACIFPSRNGYDPHMREANTMVWMNRLAAGESAEFEFAERLNRNCTERS